MKKEEVEEEEEDEVRKLVELGGAWVMGHWC